MLKLNTNDFNKIKEESGESYIENNSLMMMNSPE